MSDQVVTAAETEAAAAQKAAAPDAAAGQIRRLGWEEMPWQLRACERLRRYVDAVGRFGSWFILPLVLITMFDVLTRKVGRVQYWITENITSWLGSTPLQETEWHMHTVLFALVLGYGYIWNTHVRVDLVREHLAFRKKAWIEFAGLTLFLIPYTATIVYFSSVFAWDSYQVSEQSASLVGLPHRFIIKGVLVFGLVTTLFAGIAVWLQVAFALFGPKDVRFPLMTLEWPEEQGTFIEGKQRLDLDQMEDHLEKRASQWNSKAGS